VRTLYEIKVDTNGDSVADLGCNVQFALSGLGKVAANATKCSYESARAQIRR